MQVIRVVVYSPPPLPPFFFSLRFGMGALDMLCPALLNGVLLPGRRREREFEVRQPAFAHPRPRPSHLSLRPQENHHGFPVPQESSGQVGSRQSQRLATSTRAPSQRSQTPRSSAEDVSGPTPARGSLHGRLENAP